MSGLFFPEDERPTTYPHRPGWRAEGTSREAAEGIAPKAKPLRERVLAELRQAPGSPEQLAKRLGEPVMNIRPRLSEASKLGLVRDSGKRGRAQGGRMAIIWEIVP